MSTSWDIYCQDCSVGAGFDWYHGDEQLVKIASYAPLLADIARAMRAGLDVTEMRLGYGAGYVGPDFFLAHEGHALVVKSEYGDLLDDCARRNACEHCGQDWKCRRRREHSGACSKERDYDPRRTRESRR